MYALARLLRLVPTTIVRTCYFNKEIENADRD
jgi:hypothetical protein